MLEFNISQYNAIKLSAHVVQAVCIFVSWAIEIAVFKATTSVVNGQNGWYFGLVSAFSSIAPFGGQEDGGRC
jgi:hypothetical protein